VTGLETESPRGRIYFARAVDEGRIPLTAVVQGHWDLCLQCRACEAVCPSGVAYGRIIEHVKAQVAADPPSGGMARRVRRFLLRNVVARPRVLALACLPARAYAALGPLRRLLEAKRLPGRAGRLTDLLRSVPRRTGRPFRPGERIQPGSGERRAILFTGCVMAEVFGDVHRSTARVLQRAGFGVDVPAEQVCCGALHAHDGDLEFARRLARTNIDALEGPDRVPIVLNSAGCGAAMKEYGQLLAGDATYAERAARFAARVRDLSEVLGPGAGRLPREESVAYQDACHLAHAQRIRQQPRDLLASIEGASLVETDGADMCCGAAGIYSLVQPAMSAELRARKAAAFAAARPGIVVTANPGCQMQYEAAVKESGCGARVMHLAQLLDGAGWQPASTQGEGATPPS
jgi:glycolate oxidase iron-sulfur subunit